MGTMASKRERMRDDVEQDHHRNLDLIKYATNRKIENFKLQIESSSGIRGGQDPSGEDAERDHREFMETLRAIGQENVRETKQQLRD